ncbi:hypothetical protein J6590_029430 [Homalodisca vitripennis]|nr:hypothetical protein J6590_029430 [Homalodisca vitripennis]
METAPDPSPRGDKSPATIADMSTGYDQNRATRPRARRAGGEAAAGAALAGAPRHDELWSPPLAPPTPPPHITACLAYIIAKVTSCNWRGVHINLLHDSCQRTLVRYRIPDMLWHLVDVSSQCLGRGSHCALYYKVDNGRGRCHDVICADLRWNPPGRAACVALRLPRVNHHHPAKIIASLEDCQQKRHDGSLPSRLTSSLNCKQKRNDYCFLRRLSVEKTRCGDKINTSLENCQQRRLEGSSTRLSVAATRRFPLEDWQHEGSLPRRLSSDTKVSFLEDCSSRQMSVAATRRFPRRLLSVAATRRFLPRDLAATRSSSLEDCQRLSVAATRRLPASRRLTSSSNCQQRSEEGDKLLAGHCVKKTPLNWSCLSQARLCDILQRLINMRRAPVFCKLPFPTQRGLRVCLFFAAPEGVYARAAVGRPAKRHRRCFILPHRNRQDDHTSSRRGMLQGSEGWSMEKTPIRKDHTLSDCYASDHSSERRPLNSYGEEGREAEDALPPLRCARFQEHEDVGFNPR